MADASGPDSTAAAAETMGDGPELQIRRPHRASTSAFGMVAAAHHEATRIGVEILQAGGNAIDAAVATAFALGVCEPAASGLGGQTMMMVHLAAKRRTFAVDGSSRAPYRVVPGQLTREERRRGYRATTVPSTPAVLDAIRRRYGTMSLAELLRPSIELATGGYAVSELQHALTLRERQHLRAGPAAAFYLRKGRRVPAVGGRLRQPILAQTLERLAKHGIKDFYTGEIARQIDADMVANGGLLRLDDLAQMPRPVERRPVSGHFDGARVLTFPPPGAGRVLIEMLNILSHLPERQRDTTTPLGATALAEVIRQAFVDRRDRPFDPALYAQLPVKRMLSEDYARGIARAIARRVRNRGETTHLSVMDRHGNTVGLTQSIENVFGACVGHPELGFLYNNYLSAYEHDDISHPYYLRPGAVPWASVAPTIAFRGPKPWLVIGSPGSERITSSIAQVLLAARRQSFYGAVDAPRLHCSLEGKVSLEAERMHAGIPAALERHGFTVDRREAYSFYLGCVQLVAREGERFIGVADPRRDGAAAGPTS